MTLAMLKEVVMDSTNPHQMSVEQWRALLLMLDRANDPRWIQSLEQRKREEAEFHDQREDRKSDGHEDPTKVGGNKKYYCYTQASRAYSEAWIRQNAPGKVFLDYACGEGNATVAAAQAGAKLAIGIDISGESIERARRQAEAKGVGSSTVFIQADCEDTRLPAGSVDLIYCCGMLHHLDLSYAFPEMRRIMTPGAKAFGYEALNYNPLIKLYRKLTPELRTAWEKEHILSLKDLEFARRFFEVEDVRYWNLTVMAAPHLPFLAPAFAAIDAVLTKIPLVQLMSWIFTFELRKSLHLK